MSTYLGLDVLDTVSHNAVTPVTEGIERLLELVDPGTGKTFSDLKSVAPAPTRIFRWTAFSLAEAAAMRTFLDARRGRAVPFWLPSYQQDLTLSQDLAQNGTTASVVWIGYARYMFPSSGARRHVALYALGGGPMGFSKVTGATDPNDGLTESLALGTPASRLYPAASTVVSFLKLCRLETDTVRIAWYRAGVAQCEIPVRELPLEAQS